MPAPRSKRAWSTAMLRSPARGGRGGARAATSPAPGGWRGWGTGNAPGGGRRATPAGAPASIDPCAGRVTWMGSGTGAGLVQRANSRDAPDKSYPAARGGIVGLSLPRQRPTVTSFQHGDVLILATDGLRLDWQEHVRVG